MVCLRKAEKEEGTVGASFSGIPQPKPGETFAGASRVVQSWVVRRAGREVVRIAIDTNSLVAALTKPRGSSARILRAWREGKLEVVASEATLREVESVLRAGWMARLASKREVDELVGELRSRAVRVRPEPVLDLPLKDEGDLRLVEAAVSGGASYLVTSDREVLLQRGYARVEFVTPVEFVRVFRARSGRPD